MKKIFAVQIQKYLGKPFREGAYGNDAYDCVGLVWRFLYDNGVKIPVTWNGYDVNNYFFLARGSKKNEVAVLREWLLTLGEEKNTYEKIAGDILLIDAVITQFPAIYCGNNHALAAFRDGVKMFSLGGKINAVLVIRGIK